MNSASEIGHTVQMAAEETQMLTQIEDISDSMNRDIQKANIKNKQTAVNIAFFDLS